MAQNNFPAIIPSLQIGGRLITDLSNLIILYGSFSGAANGNTTLRKQDGSAGYAVTSGKTFVVVAVEIDLIVIAASTSCTFGYADNDVGVEVNTAFTNAVYTARSASMFRIPTVTLGSYQRVPNLSVPAGKYLFVTNQAGACVGSMRVFGYEV